MNRVLIRNLPYKVVRELGSFFTQRTAELLWSLILLHALECKPNIFCHSHLTLIYVLVDFVKCN